MKELIIFILGMLLGSVITIIEFHKQFTKKLKELELGWLDER